MSINPVEIPTGAVRFNTDSSKMEVYIGDTWMEVSVTEASPLGGRGLFCGGYTYSPATQGNSNVIEYITIAVIPETKKRNDNILNRNKYLQAVLHFIITTIKLHNDRYHVSIIL